MSEELEPLDGDVLAILNTRSPIEAVPNAARERILHAVEARIAMGAPTQDAAGPPPTAPSRRSGPGSWVGQHPWVAMSTAMLVGGLVGSAARGKPEVRVVTVERAAQSVPPSAPPSSPWTAVPAPSAATSAPPGAAPRAVAGGVGPVATGQELAAESAILDIARTAIAHGEADHALAAVDRHAASFPNGMLREEREALGVKALVLAGRREDANARAARFRARYPDSLFIPALESALRSIP